MDWLIAFSFVSGNVYGGISPIYQIAYVGSKVAITCFSTFPPGWRKNGNKLLNLTDASMVINSASFEDNGTYVCLGGYESNEIFLAYSVLLVGGNL